MAEPLTGVAEEAPTFAALADAAAAGRPLVVAQLGQSLDGRIATRSGHSHYVNGPAAIAVLHRLRALVDVVVVGAGTARADDPQLTVRHCAGRSPARALVDRRRSAGGALRMLADDGARRIVFGPPHADDPPGVETVAVAADGTISPRAIVAALAERGLHRVLVEGGAHTVSAFLDAGALDRLCVLVAPMLIGSGPVGLNLHPIDRLDDALRPAVRSVALEGGDVLFDCALR